MILKGLILTVFAVSLSGKFVSSFHDTSEKQQFSGNILKRTQGLCYTFVQAVRSGQYKTRSVPLIWIHTRKRTPSHTFHFNHVF